MDDEPCRQFFREPQQTLQRRYEALRSFFLEGRPIGETAAKFGYRISALRTMICRFRAGCRAGQVPPFFFRTDADALLASNAAKTSTARNRPTRPTAAS